MALAIVATPGSGTANSYVTAAEMTTYCEGRLNASAWMAADAQLPALVEATRDLSLLSWIGQRTDAVQVLAWPRTFAVDPDAPLALGTATVVGYPYFDDDEIPQRVKDATCELALEYLKAGTTDLAAQDATTGILEKTVGPLTTIYAEPHKRPAGLARFPRVLQLIEPLLDAEPAGSLTIARV